MALRRYWSQKDLSCIWWNHKKKRVQVWKTLNGFKTMAQEKVTIRSYVNTDGIKRKSINWRLPLKQNTLIRQLISTDQLSLPHGTDSFPAGWSTSMHRLSPVCKVHCAWFWLNSPLDWCSLYFKKRYLLYQAFSSIIYIHLILLF